MLKTISLGSSLTTESQPWIAEPFPNGKFVKKKGAPTCWIFCEQFFQWETALWFAVEIRLLGISQVRSFSTINGYYFSSSKSRILIVIKFWRLMIVEWQMIIFTGLSVQLFNGTIWFGQWTSLITKLNHHSLLKSSER